MKARNEYHFAINIDTERLGFRDIMRVVRTLRKLNKAFEGFNKLAKKGVIKIENKPGVKE